MKTRIFSIALAALVLAGFNVNAQCSSSSKKAKSTSTSYSAWGGSGYSSHGSDIVDLAVGTDQLSTLVAAVKAAGLVDVLKGDGPFTVFAPTDEAFAALPEGTLTKLLKPENKEMLQKILTYHVVAGEYGAAHLADGQRVATVQGDKVIVSKNNQGVMIDNAAVVKADIDASNGIVHVINKVILPPEL